jgi:hypothetical protein
MSVHRSRLIIEDGMGASRRRRELARIERAIRRIVILTDSDTNTLEAVPWCASVGIALIQLDGDGRPLLVSSWFEQETDCTTQRHDRIEGRERPHLRVARSLSCRCGFETASCHPSGMSAHDEELPQSALSPSEQARARRTLFGISAVFVGLALMGLAGTRPLGWLWWLVVIIGAGLGSSRPQGTGHTHPTQHSPDRTSRRSAGSRRDRSGLQLPHRRDHRRRRPGDDHDLNGLGRSHPQTHHIMPLSGHAAQLVAAFKRHNPAPRSARSSVRVSACRSRRTTSTPTPSPLRTKSADCRCHG